jgi:trimeric autotransporter adhesin
MTGCAGNATSVVDNAGDVVTEAFNEGTDTVQSSITYTLGANVENLTLTGSGNINGTGNGDANVITGNSGNNVITGGGGNDTIDGGAGNDTIQYAVGDGVDTIDGGADTDTLAVSGTAGSDTIDVVVNGSGVITSIEGMSPTNVENYTLDGLANTAAGDTLDYTGTASAVIVNLATNSATGFTSATGIENVTGGSGNDTLSGDSNANALTGGGGDDTLKGGGGNDTIDGGAGNDTIQYAVGDGVDTIDGGADTDTLAVSGTAGSDTVDVVVNGSGVITSIEGMSPTNVENYTLDGLGNTAAGDTLDYTGTASAVIVNLGTNSATGFTSVTGIENVTGGSAGDTLSGDANVNALTGGSGNDTIDGGGGIDTAVYTTTLALGDIVAAGGGWTVNGGAAGTDTLSNVEIVQHAGGRYLLVGNGGFADATAAAAAATHPGDTLVFATTPGGTVDINLGGSDDAHDLTIPGDVPVEITTGGGDNQITVGGGDNTITTGGGDNTITTGGGNNTITTGGGNNTITTGGGDNTITTGGSGNNTVTTGGGDDHVTTGGGADTIHTGDGNDVVNAGGGDDAIVGGQGGGNDFYDGGSGVNTVEYPSATNSVTIDLNEIDRSGDPVIGGALGAVLATAALPADTPVGYAQGADIGVDVLLNIQNATGGSGNDTIIGNGFNNILDGGIGADSLTGGSGNDTYVVDNAGDAVTETAGEGTDTVQSSIDYTLGANLENLTLTGSAFVGTGNTADNVITGNAGINVLFGLDGNDTIDSGGGADLLIGGLGNDTYIVHSGGEGIFENANEGTDTVLSTTHYALSANVENLVLLGSADLQGYGNDLANTLDGNAGNNILNGGIGADIMSGGAGNDVYFVDNAGDQVVENPGEGNDVVFSTAHFALSANVETLVLQGSADLQGYGNDGQANLLYGNAGNNLLNGEAGADAMFGGAGNDVYFVDNGGDAVIENVNEGTDTVFSTAHYALSANVENLVLQGTADLQGYGNDLANVLVGNSGNNILNGEAGADVMIGGAGNDVYFVDGGDAVIENANEGTDTVFSTTHYALSANVENLVLLGSDNLQGYGNDGANLLVGNAGNNLLNGEGGADIMRGGAGNDVYFVDDPGDIVFESANNGTDAVFATINYTLTANVETLVLQGSGNLTGTGNTLDNKLFGNSGDNTLDGGAGADRLTGGAGNDTFVFHAGQANGDVVVDFDGQGAAVGDSLSFVGYGSGSFTQVGATNQWQITSAIDAHVETITFLNGASIDPNDFLFS